MLQPSPVGAANAGDAAPQAKTFSEAMEVLGAGAYPQYVQLIQFNINKISTNYKINTSFVCTDCVATHEIARLPPVFWPKMWCGNPAPPQRRRLSPGTAKPGEMCRTNLNVW